jgi:hypothetical protein
MRFNSYDRVRRRMDDKLTMMISRVMQAMIDEALAMYNDDISGINSEELALKVIERSQIRSK